MDSRFDGLRSILGNAALAIPEVQAPAVDNIPVAAVAEAPVEAAATDSSHARRGAHADAPFVDDPASLEIDEAVFGAVPASSMRQAASRAASDVRRSALQADDDDASGRRISGWAALAVMVLGLFLGGTAAMAVFRDDVSHIFASWDASPASSQALRLQ